MKQVITKDIIMKYRLDRFCTDPDLFLCIAPFANMYFGSSGRVYCCCFCEKEEIGRYPDQSIIEIWRANKIKSIRDSIIDTSFSHKNCSGCVDSLVMGNYSACEARVYDNLLQSQQYAEKFTLARWDENYYPISMEFELSNSCNLECIMCKGDLSSAIRANVEKLPAKNSPYDDVFIEQLDEFLPFLKQARFFGGEPFLIKQYEKIWEKLIKINPSCECMVQTNGTVFTEGLIKKIKLGNFRIGVSIDSLDPKNYERIRKNAAYKQVMSNILKLYDIIGDRLSIAICPMQQNWQEIPSFVLFANKMNIHLYFNTVTFPRECSLKSLSSEKLREIYSYFERYKFPCDSEVAFYNNNLYVKLLKQIDFWVNNQ